MIIIDGPSPSPSQQFDVSSSTAEIVGRNETMVEVAIPQCQYCELERRSNWTFEDARTRLTPITTPSAADNHHSPAATGQAKGCKVESLTGKDIYHTLARYLFSCKDLTMCVDGSCQRIDIELGKDPMYAERFVKLELDIVSGLDILKHAMNNGTSPKWNGTLPK